MFTLIHGNRQEVLAQHLAARLAAAPLSIFERDVVVVQSGGMARWLQLFLAESLGVAAQLRFTFPAGYLWSLFGAVLPAVPKETPFARDILCWQLLRLLPTVPRRDEFAALTRYLADGDMAKRHGLAERLAECFDRYLAYRPQWVGAWLAGERVGLGEHEAWQACLWQQIGAEAGELPEAHPAELFFRALEEDMPLSPTLPFGGQDRSTPQASAGLRSLLPKRITVFGSGAMPPPYLDIFKRLGDFIEVNFYLVNPCREYWGDLVTQRVKARAALATPELMPLLETGHPLLGSLGQVTRATFDRLAGENDVELFVTPAGETLLATLQADMLAMRQRGEDERVVLRPDDGSIQFHICHGAARELEVLHDRLLALFAADPTLRPSDVLVLTPDILTMAPLIEAVFSAPPPMSRQRIPFTIADRPLELEASLLRAFYAVLDLAAGRLDAESVLGVLAQPCIAARFGLDEEGLELIRTWVGESGIRWGMSAAARAQRGLPAEELHSWAFGLRRMLLGMALPQQLLATPLPGAKLFADTLPFDGIEGVRTQILGRLLSFLDALEHTLQELSVPRTVADWVERLPQVCQRFCYDPDQLNRADASTQRATQKLLTTLQGLAKAATQARCDVAVPLDVMRRELTARLNNMPPGWAFLGGGVTFAQLMAYRGVPARVLCLLGMNDGAFPRNPAQPGFDLLHQYPQAGDREVRAEDRHAFFEALLSVRETLHISYSGRGIRDNAELPPSPLVAELMDAIDITVIAEGGEKASAAVSVPHRLQAFSSRYFDGSDARLYSHAAHYAAAACAAQQRVATAGLPFIATPLDKAPPELLHITPQQFVDCFANPARYLLRNRLGIQLAESDGLLDTVEPFVPKDLQRYHLRTQLVNDWQAGVRDGAAAYALANARGELPHGEAGRVWFDGMWNEFAPLAARIAVLGGVALPPQRIALDFGVVHIHGSLGDLQQTDSDVCRLRWRIGDIRPQDKLQLWLEHQLLHAAGQPCRSFMITDKGSFSLAPLASVVMQPFADVYQRAVCELLPFFAQTSFAWAAAQRSKKETDWMKPWADEYKRDAESDDAYIDLAWREADPFAAPYRDEFEALATLIYGSMLNHAAGGDDE